MYYTISWRMGQSFLCSRAADCGASILPHLLFSVLCSLCFALFPPHAFCRLPAPCVSPAARPLRLVHLMHFAGCRHLAFCPPHAFCRLPAPCVLPARCVLPAPCVLPAILQKERRRYRQGRTIQQPLNSHRPCDSLARLRDHPAYSNDTSAHLRDCPAYSNDTSARLRTYG